MRLVCSGRGLVNVDRVELRAVDGTSNPYLCLAGLLAAGMHGVEHEIKLPRPVQINPASMAPNKQPQFLPQTLLEAIRDFQADWLSDEAFGSEFADILARLRLKEWNHCHELKSDEAVLALLKTRY